MTKQVKRVKIEIDGANQIVGRLATKIASILIGKNKAQYEDNLDNGDYVKVINASQIRFSGKKLVQKDYHHHSMHPGGLKIVSAKKVMKENPAQVIRHAVNGMLPKNKLRNGRMKRLTITK